MSVNVCECTTLLVHMFTATQVGRDTLFDQLHKKVESIDGGKFHTLSHGLREEVERLSKQEHKWDLYNIDQLVSTKYFHNTNGMAYIVHVLHLYACMYKKGTHRYMYVCMF